MNLPAAIATPGAFCCCDGCWITGGCCVARLLLWLLCGWNVAGIPGSEFGLDDDELLGTTVWFVVAGAINESVASADSEIISIFCYPINQ